MLKIALIAMVLQLPAIDEIESSGYQALRDKDLAKVKAAAAKLASSHPNSFSAAMARGSLLLRAGMAKQALKAFDEAAQLQPKQIPYMWQRGIAQYYAGEYDAGRDQFVVHREVNANDVENAVWHFICVAKRAGFDKAREGYLPAPGDPRPPMQQVYDLFGGQATVDDVIQAMQKYPPSSRAAESAGFYGELYLGLYEDARGDIAAAKKWLEKAVARGQTHYMADVARVHLDQLRQKDPPTKSGAAAK